MRDAGRERRGTERPRSHFNIRLNFSKKQRGFPESDNNNSVYPGFAHKVLKNADIMVRGYFVVGLYGQEPAESCSAF
jgi:hypothetical protein